MEQSGTDRVSLLKGAEIMTYQTESNNKGVVSHLKKNWIAITASMVSFVAGLFGQAEVEWYKHNLEQAEVLTAQRTVLWKSATDHFAQYINNWERARIIYLDRIDPQVKKDAVKCSIEFNKIKLGKDVQTRLDRYIQDRDKQKDLLAADLEEARFIYGNTDVLAEIEKFDKFREENKARNPCELPEVNELRKIERGILLAMLKEMSKSIERK